MTLKFIQRTDKVRKDGTSPIYLRITSHRKSRFISTGTNVLPKHWNASRERVRAGNPKHKVYNEALDRAAHKSLEVELKGKAEGDGSVSALAIKRGVVGNSHRALQNRPVVGTSKAASQ